MLMEMLVSELTLNLHNSLCIYILLFPICDVQFLMRLIVTHTHTQYAHVPKDNKKWHAHGLHDKIKEWPVQCLISAEGI